MSTKNRKRKSVDKEEDEESDNESSNPLKKRKIKKKKRYKYHPGDLEVDWYAWPDHDEECHGRIDTNANRREYPENFKWNCCDEQGNESGCESRSNPATPLSEKYATSPEPLL
eukprot:44544_1